MKWMLLSVLVGAICVFADEGKTLHIPSPFIDGGQIEIYVQKPDTIAKKLLVSIGGADNPGASVIRARKEWYSHWTQKGYCVAEVFLPGFGATTGKKDLHGPLSVQTLGAAIDMLKAEYQLEQVGITGFGYGGATALLLVAQRNDINCLVCANGLGNLIHMKSNSEWMARFLSRDYDLDMQDEEALNKRTPLYQIDTINTPIYLLHRFPNRFVDLADVEEFIQAMSDKGKKCQLSIRSKRPGDHEEHVSRQEVLDVAEEWIEQHME